MTPGTCMHALCEDIAVLLSKKKPARHPNPMETLS